MGGTKPKSSKPSNTPASTGKRSANPLIHVPIVRLCNLENHMAYVDNMCRANCDSSSWLAYEYAKLKEKHHTLKEQFEQAKFTIDVILDVLKEKYPDEVSKADIHFLT